MISDNSVIELFRNINNELELALRNEAIKDKNHKDNLVIQDLQQLQEQLQRVRLVVDNICNELAKNNHQKPYQTINFKSLLDIELDCEITEPVSNRDLSHLVKNAIQQYVMVLCYYTIMNKCLIQLPEIYEAESYYSSIEATGLNRLIYLTQTSIPRVYQFGKYIIKNIPPGKSLERIAPSKLFNRVKPLIDEIFMVQGLQLVGLPTVCQPKDIIKLVKLPQLYISKEIQGRINDIHSYNVKYTTKLGMLNSNFKENRFDSLRLFFELDKSSNLRQIVEATRKFGAAKHLGTKNTRRPSFIGRYWPLITLSILYGPYSVVTIWKNRYRILDFFQKNIIEFCSGLVHNWLWIPIKKVWATVRHDEGSEIAMISRGTLKTERESLERMVVSFVVDNSTNVDLNKEDLVKQVEHGELNQFMHIYEHQLHHPITNILTGKLIRSLLIQVQKTKVDGSLALDGIDKMLQSQQLVFGVMAVSPAALFVYLTLKVIIRFIKMGNIWSNLQQVQKKLSASLNNVERILNYSDVELHISDKHLHEGMLLMEISNTYSYGLKIIPKNRQNDWYKDVEELTNSKFSNATKLNVINRIYHSYGRYF